jgi:O-antigen ligase
MTLQARQSLFYFFPVFFCFCLPFGSLLLSGIIIGWAVVSLFNVDKTSVTSGFRNPLLWVMYGFFLLTLVSAALSENFTEAVFEVEIKLSLLLFPWLLFCFPYPLEILRRCVTGFVSGCFFACLYLVGRAFFYMTGGHPEYFFYTQFSFFIHAGYFAMYLVLAIVLVVVLYPRWYREQRPVIYSSWFFLAFFTAGIFLCASKMGILTFFVCLPLLVLYRMGKKYRARAVIIVLCVFAGVLWLSTLLFPAAFDRWASLRNMSEAVDPASTESTAVRRLIWHEAWEIGKRNWVFGTEVGDANPALYEAYHRNGLSGAYERRLNAHNQYLQTFVGLGLAGLLFLFALTVGQLINAIRARNFLLAMFSLVTTLNFTVESMLQASAGILFFVFFTCLFNLTSEEELTGPLSSES